MPNDIKNLSSRELFELAKRKEKEEQEANQRVARLAEIKKEIASLIASHQASLAATDKAIRELQEKRNRLISDFKAAITPLELDIQELERKVKMDQLKSGAPALKMQPQSTPGPVSLAPNAPTPPPQASQSASITDTPKQATSAQQSADSSPPAPTDSSEELLTKIKHIMRSRTYISESLLKEKLKTNGFNTSNLKQDIEKLIREGKLEKKGVGNYALGKKR